jgi:predicted nuclease of predicted toxin-antitoxin system
MDKDFGELAYLAGLPHAGILLLRMDEASGDEKANAIRAIFASHANKLAGAFAVYNKKKLRIRPTR